MGLFWHFLVFCYYKVMKRRHGYTFYKNCAKLAILRKLSADIVEGKNCLRHVPWNMGWEGVDYKVSDARPTYSSFIQQVNLLELKQVIWQLVGPAFSFLIAVLDFILDIEVLYKKVLIKH